MIRVFLLDLEEPDELVGTGVGALVRTVTEAEDKVIFTELSKVVKLVMLLVVA